MAEESRAKEERMLDAVARVPDYVVHRSFEAETLLLNLETGQYHGLNETGGRMLQLLEVGDGRVSTAIEQLADEVDVDPEEIADDLIAFCEDLAERGLIELQETRDGGGR